jgi:hypothetical protein
MTNSFRKVLLSGLGFAPIPIETPAGREEYERHQRDFTARGEPLRARLQAAAQHALVHLASDDRPGGPGTREPGVRDRG